MYVLLLTKEDMIKKTKLKRGRHIPEDRIMPNAFFAEMAILPIGALLFGWGVKLK